MSRAAAPSASTNGATVAGGGGGGTDASNGERSYFEMQREGIMREIGGSIESVLQNINKLNRSLEGIISVGNEFSSVEALWSHFENVMAKDAGGEEEEEEIVREAGGEGEGA